MQTSDASNFFRAEADIAKSDARAAKAARTKSIGEPIELKGKTIRMRIQGQDAWTAESGAVIRRTSLKTGATLQLFKGHTAPVTALEFFESNGKTFLISGSWDQTIKVWDIETKEVLSTTPAHTDFVKSLLVVPSLGVLVSGSSDKTVRIWDLSSILSDPTSPLRQLETISAHTRPVQALAWDSTSSHLYTGDSMGVIKIWSIDPGPVDRGSRARLVGELNGHRTGVNEIWARNGKVWSASTDSTVMIHTHPMSTSTAAKTITHASAVKSILPLHLSHLDVPYLITGAGEVLSTYDISTIDERDGKAELLNIADVHSHDITALGWWVRDVDVSKVIRREPWIVSGSLDGTLRRWRLADLVSQPADSTAGIAVPPPAPASSSTSGMTEEEERELAELMDELGD